MAGSNQAGRVTKFSEALQQRLARGMAALKEFGVTANSDYGWNVRTGRRHSTFYAGSDVDWEKEAGTLWENPAVALCVIYLFNKVVEPRLQVVASDSAGKDVPIPAHPLTQLLAHPNGEYRGSALLRAAALSYKINGNGYIVLVRDAGGAGTPRELWYVPHWQMEPMPPDGGGPTQFYRHVVGNHSQLYPRRNVIHLKFGIDPENPRQGLAPFRALLRSVVSDGEIETYTASILKNLGIIGAMVSPADPKDEILPEQADTLRSMINEQTTGDLRARIIVPNVPIRIDKVGVTPQEMALDKIGDRPESRICAAFGFEPMAIGLPAGNTTYANKSEAREASLENGIIPCLSDFAEALSEDLLPAMGDAQGARVVWDYSNVRDLQPDMNQQHRRGRDNFTRGLWKLNEARIYTGLQPDPGHDGYAWQLLPAKVAAGAAEGAGD